MNQTTHDPTFPLDSGTDALSTVRAIGHLAAAAFVAGVIFLSAQIMAFEPSADADCLPEICGPAH